MFVHQSLRSFLYFAVNIIVSLFLVFAFYYFANPTIKKIHLARESGFTRITPDPMNYLWKINIDNVPVDKNLIRIYTDYYDQLLLVLPNETDIEGILGFCYYQLGNKNKAEDFLKKAINKDPYYFWYYYNLAVINIEKKNYPTAISLLQKALQIDPRKTLYVIGESQWIYLPLVGSNRGEISKISEHLRVTYKQSLFLLQDLQKSLEEESIDTFVKTLNLKIYAF